MAPENTLAAFEQGARCGFKAFECDVKVSADGVAFLMHDTTLDRTTGEPGVAEEKSWAQLSQLDAGRWHGVEFEGVRIPKLADIARFCFDTDSALNIEIKPTPGHESRTGELVAIEAAALWQGRPVSPLLSDLAQRLVALLGAWNEPAAHDLFTDNVVLDESFERRAAAGQALREACGGTLEVVDVVATTAAAGSPASPGSASASSGSTAGCGAVSGRRGGGWLGRARTDEKLREKSSEARAAALRR